eukprot:gene8840-48254_t
MPVRLAPAARRGSRLWGVLRAVGQRRHWGNPDFAEAAQKLGAELQSMRPDNWEFDSISGWARW